MNSDPTEYAQHFPTIPGYRVDAVLGRGGMGIVYLATDQRLQRQVAIKCLPNGSQQRTIERFIEEAQAVSQLRHPNIAQLFAFNAEHQPPYYVMELVDGGTLDDLIRDKALTAHSAAEVLETLCRAVHVAHQAGILHRDIKPSNVLLQRAADQFGDSVGPNSSTASCFDTTVYASPTLV